MNANGFPYNGEYNNDYKKMQFYYHPDHLGSSSYITNFDGEVAQHIEYVPFGEVFIDELELMRKSATAGKTNCNNTWNTAYRFNDCANEGRGKLACSMPSAANRRVELNAKELDEETGLYYYGARYYYPRLSLWMSTDPKEENYPDVNSYSYTKDNPANFIDSHGMEPDEAQNTPKPQKSKKIYYAPDSQKKLIIGYPGQAAEELLTKGIQWLAQKVSGEKISEESA